MWVHALPANYLRLICFFPTDVTALSNLGGPFKSSPCFDSKDKIRLFCFPVDLHFRPWWGGTHLFGPNMRVGGGGCREEKQILWLTRRDSFTQLNSSWIGNSVIASKINYLLQFNYFFMLYKNSNLLSFFPLPLVITEIYWSNWESISLQESVSVCCNENLAAEVA